MRLFVIGHYGKGKSTILESLKGNVRRSGFMNNFDRRRRRIGSNPDTLSAAGVCVCTCERVGYCVCVYLWACGVLCVCVCVQSYNPPPPPHTNRASVHSWYWVRKMELFTQKKEKWATHHLLYMGLCRPGELYSTCVLYIHMYIILLLLYTIIEVYYNVNPCASCLVHNMDQVL